MMKLLSIPVFLFSLFFSFSSQAKAPYLRYTLSRKDSVTLSVKVVFTGNGNGVTLLHLPSEWAGQESLYTAISGITALSPGATVMPTDKPYTRLIRYKPGTRVEFSYLLHKDWPGELRYPLYFRPVIRPDFFYFEGYSGLVYPQLADTAHIRCRLTYEGFDKADFIGNSFYAGKNDGCFTVRMDELLNSIFCAGNFRSKSIKVKGHRVTVALTGTPAFSDEAAFSSISKIIFAERHFWNDAGPAYYFTVFLPLYDGGNTGGTAHYRAFSLFQSVDLGLSGELLPMIAHEYFHNWLGLGLKMPEPDEPYKWFSEGFTDYYACKILYETGAISRDDFLTRVNRSLKNYFLSPYFNLPNRELIGRYWESRALKQLSYYRGLAVACMLDDRIAEKSGRSLDDLLRELYRQSAPSMLFSDSLFHKLVADYSDSTTLAAVNGAVAGRNEQLSQLLFADRQYRMDTLNIDRVFDLGFNLEASKIAGKVVGLTPGSNAEKAGLTENMPLNNKFSIWFNNTEKPALIGVIDSSGETFIEYIPVLRVDKKIPQLVIEE